MTDQPTVGQLYQVYLDGKRMAEEATAQWEAMTPEIRTIFWEQLDDAGRETLEFAVRVNDTWGRHWFAQNPPVDQDDLDEAAASDAIDQAADVDGDEL